MNTPRFIPQKRTALDGKVWWCVFDTVRRQWSTYIYHGKYRTRKACQDAIDRSERLIFN